MVWIFTEGHLSRDCLSVNFSTPDTRAAETSMAVACLFVHAFGLAMGRTRFFTDQPDKAPRLRGVAAPPRERPYQTAAQGWTRTRAAASKVASTELAALAGGQLARRIPCTSKSVSMPDSHLRSVSEHLAGQSTMSSQRTDIRGVPRLGLGVMAMASCLAVETQLVAPHPLRLSMDCALPASASRDSTPSTGSYAVHTNLCLVLRRAA